MQKKLIALAVAGLVSAPAFAQSNVQIYGVVDAGFVAAKGDENKFRGVQSGLLSASRIGFRGTEDLGNGLKAVFTLEYGIAVDEGIGPNGTSTGSARQSFVGLQGGFGFIGLGRQYSPGHNILGNLDHFGGSAAFAPHLKLLGGTVEAATIQNAGGGRINNAISYKSPTMSGFSVEAMYAFGEGTPQDDSDARKTGDLLGIGGQYKNGGLTAGLVYHKREGGAADDRKEWMAGAGYDFGVVAVNGIYQQVKVGSDKDKVYTVNAKVPVTSAGAVLLGYSKLSADDSDFDANSWTVAYTHSLSKRTTAYAGYNRVSNDDLQNRVAASGLNAETGENSGGFVVGLRHTF